VCVCVCVWDIFFSHLSVDGHVGWFHNFPALNSVLCCNKYGCTDFLCMVTDIPLTICQEMYIKNV
jgi:hypothetical protein